VGQTGNSCKTMSTIPKTSISQISLRAIVAGVGSQCLGRGKHASKCNIMDGKK